MKNAAMYGYGNMGYQSPELLNPRLRKLRPELVSRNFMQDRGTHRHAGVDIGIGQGSVLAFNQPVKVTGTGNDPGGYGYWMEFQLPNGHKVLKGHLSQIPKGFKQGMTIPAGKSVALSGGRAGTPGAGRTTGDHLHFEERDKKGNLLDPSRPGGAVEYILTNA